MVLSDDGIWRCPKCGLEFRPKPLSCVPRRKPRVYSGPNVDESSILDFPPLNLGECNPLSPDDDLLGEMLDVKMPDVAQLKAEVAELREALEDISDHNSALERMNYIKAQAAEIKAQAAEITRLRSLLEQK